MPTESPDPAPDLAGLARACRYSFATNRLNYCGPENAFQDFKSFVDRPSASAAPRIRRLLLGFTGLNLYLDLLASANGLDRFDEQVIEAYWLGNALLDRVPFEGFRRALSTGLVAAGLPLSIVEAKVSRLLPSFNAHHSFHVLYVNFITPKVEKILANLDRCLPLAGEVVKVQGASVEVESPRLAEDGHALALVGGHRRALDNPFGVSVGPGDLVSLHWGTLVEPVSEKQAKALERYTRANLETVNSLRRAP